jgi:hypothetical protein
LTDLPEVVVRRGLPAEQHDAPIYVDLNVRRPRLRIYAEAEKGHQDRVLPLAPDFVEFLRQIPEAERHGPVFAILA